MAYGESPLRWSRGNLWRQSLATRLRTRTGDCRNEYECQPGSEAYGDYPRHILLLYMSSHRRWLAGSFCGQPRASCTPCRGCSPEHLVEPSLEQLHHNPSTVTPRFLLTLATPANRRAWATLRRLHHRYAWREICSGDDRPPQSRDTTDPQDAVFVGIYGSQSGATQLSRGQVSSPSAAQARWLVSRLDDVRDSASPIFAILSPFTKELAWNP